MKAIHKAAGAARNRLFRRSVQDETQRMDPLVRTALVEDCQTPAATLKHELAQIEDDIAQARQALQTSEEKEVFLGQRSRQYRRVLDDQARHLQEQQARLDAAAATATPQQKNGNHSEAAGGEAQNNNNNNEHDENDVEGKIPQTLLQQDELNRKLAKWQRDHDALSSIVETHKQILGRCETMRWQLRELEAKRQGVRAQLLDCTDFLDAAQELRQGLVNAANHGTDSGGGEEQQPLHTQQQQETMRPDPMIQIINDNHDDDGYNTEDDQDGSGKKQINDEEESAV